MKTAFCDRWSGYDKQLCDSFINAEADDKFTAAVSWRKQARATYECSGITAECLHDDIHSQKPGTSCKHITEGSECEFGTCKGGICSSPTEAQQPQPQQEQQLEQPEADEGDYDDTDVDDTTSPERRILAAKRKQSLKSKKSIKSKDAKNANKRLANTKAGQTLYASMSQSAILGMLKKGPNPSWQTAQATVSTSKNWGRVPETFLATSHAWVRIHDYADDRMAHAWANIFNTISPSPIIRVGGADQDRMAQAPSQSTWDALKKIRAYTNARFVIGLPLWPKNAVVLSKKIIADAKRNLGGSVIVFELGNEPEFWPSGLGGWGKDGKWKKGFEAYADWFDRVARAINPCGSGKMLSGPGWGNLNTQPVKWTATTLYRGKDCYLKEVNLHYYPYVNNHTVTARELLSQPLQDFGVEKYKEFHRIVTDKEKIGIRISETNSLYGGGRPDLSDTLVGALWVTDALFAFSNAGAKAFHLHWGVGGDPSGTLGQPNTGVQTNFHFDVKPGEAPVPWPSVHAPWYGYLLFTVATAGQLGKRADTTFVPAAIDNRGKCGANVKVWGLKADNGQLRIVLINKDESVHCNLRVNVPGNFCARPAVMTRMLPDERGIYAKGGIYFQGQNYDNSGYTGKLQGQYENFSLKPEKFKDGKCGFRVPVPAASAAIVFAR